MTKNQKMLLGLGAVAVVGYFIYQNNKPKGFAGEKMNATGRPRIFGRTVSLENKCKGADGGTGTTPESAGGTCCHSGESVKRADGRIVFKCCKGAQNWAEGTFNGGCTGAASATAARGGMGLAY
jgi:hypothetical protein